MNIYNNLLKTLTIGQAIKWSEFFGTGYEVEDGRVVREVDFETGEPILSTFTNSGLVVNKEVTQ